MVTSISNVSPGKKIGAMDKVSQEQLYDPGLYALRELMMEPQPVYREKHGFLRFLGRIVLFTAAVCGGAVAARKFAPALQKLDVTEKLDKEAKLGDKAKYYVAKLADWVEDNLKDLFSKKKPTDSTPSSPPTANS